MAVAVKSSPGAKSSSSPGSVTLISMVGVVYLLACLAIVFKLLPSLWWPMWANLVGTDASGVKYQVGSGTLLLLIGLVVGIGLLWLGGRLLGPKPPAGVRAGVFFGFAGLIIAALLTRLVSNYIEASVYDSVAGGLSRNVGSIIVGVVGGALVAGLLYVLNLPVVHQWLVKIEEMGWFHATSYKRNQGHFVRRATIIGLLILASTGIWTLASSGRLRRGSSDWVLNIPFTGTVALDATRDAKEFIQPEDVTGFEIRWPGKSNLLVGTQVNRDRYLSALKDSIKDYKTTLDTRIEREQAALSEARESKATEESIKKLQDSLSRSEKELKEIAEVEKKLEAANETTNPVLYLDTVNRIVHAGIKEHYLEGTTFHADIRRRLGEVERQTPWTDMSKLNTAVKREAEAARQGRDLNWTTVIPIAVPIVERAALNEANKNTNPDKNVRIGLRVNPKFMPDKMEGDTVETGKFDDAEVEVYKQLLENRLPKNEERRSEAAKKALTTLSNAKNGADFREKVANLISETTDDDLKGHLEFVQAELKRDEDAPKNKSDPVHVPVREPLRRASGVPHSANIVMLPNVQFTLPLIMMVAAVWFAWRAVNFPVFADFLIATEAEMNKVSWTTQKRLVQDTIVVLVTVVVMGLFLFSMDFLWKQVLSLEDPINIGVLHIPKDAKNERLKLDEKRW